MESRDIETAERAAGSWLALIDVGAYDEGWQQTTGDIRHRTEQISIQWMQERHGSIGPLLRRTIVYAGPIRFSREEPEGEYLEIEYDTDFAKLSHLFEYVRTVRGKDGAWAVCWYFIRQRPPSELSQTDNSS